jgi:hypothetical protein
MGYLLQGELAPGPAPGTLFSPLSTMEPGPRRHLGNERAPPRDGWKPEGLRHLLRGPVLQHRLPTLLQAQELDVLRHDRRLQIRP